MDDILNLGDDISTFLDIPSSFCDDEILRELDTLDFINDFEDDLTFDYEVDKHLSNPDIRKPFSNDSISCHDRNINFMNNNAENGGNYKCNEMNYVKNEAKENAEQKLMIIRELLDSNTCIPTSTVIPSLQSFNNRTMTNKPSSTGDNGKRSNQRAITSKHPAILPSTNVSSSSLMKSPTLAATLISMQPSKVNLNSVDNHQNSASTIGTGRVVRHNSHNAIEKRYRLSINDKIDELRHMLFLGDDSKMNKSNVLKKAIQRIKSLEEENNALKCDIYTLRLSRNLPVINNGNSIESLNRTGSSPSSNNSDCGQSIENSPSSSSSSMHSSSVASGSLFVKSNENNFQRLSNSNRGIKRPLIYNSNSSNENMMNNTVKSEKLARLLLDPKEQPYSTDIQNNQNMGTKFHSSNVPGLLLCTMALFVISFQPLDVILNKYKSESSPSTSGRQILQYSVTEDMSSNRYLLAMFLTLTHWSVAFFLVWASTHNRFLLKKSLSLFVWKIQTFLFNIIYDERSPSVPNLIDLKSSLEGCLEDRILFKTNLDKLIKEYDCSYRTNPLKKLFQFLIFLTAVLISFIRHNLHSKRSLNDRQKIRIYLLTVAIDQSFVDKSSYSRVELMWYQCLLYALTWNTETTNDTLYSRFVLALSIKTGFIRRWVLNKVIQCANCHSDSGADKHLIFLMNDQVHKLLIKTNSCKLKDRFYSHCLDKVVSPENQSLINCYFMVHVQETIETASQIILDGKTDEKIADQLKEIIDCCPSILNNDEATYYSLWCCLFFVLLKKEDNLYLNQVVTKLTDHYELMSKRTGIENADDPIKSIIVLKLLTSTLQLGGKPNDKVYHDLNIKYIHDLLSISSLNPVFQMLFKLSHNLIIHALSTFSSLSPTFDSNIVYYSNAYARKLNNEITQQSSIGKEMVGEFEKLLQNICRLNPLREIRSEKENAKPFTNSNPKTINDFCYRITDFLSLERDSKLRSH